MLMRDERSVPGALSVRQNYNSRIFENRFRRSGGYGAEPPPDPISNSAVKVRSANGTTS
jgi:hypothetical protein